MCITCRIYRYPYVETLIIYHIPPILRPPPLGMSLSSLMESVEKIQYQAGLAITGCWKGSSFLPRAIDSCNSIMTHFEFVPTFNHLKKYMLALYSPTSKPVFGIHDPIGLRYLVLLILVLIFASVSKPRKTHITSYLNGFL